MAEIFPGHQEFQTATKTKQSSFVSAPPRPFQTRQNSQIMTFPYEQMEQKPGALALTTQNQHAGAHLQNGHTFRNEALSFTPSEAFNARNTTSFAVNNIEASAHGQTLDRPFVPTEKSVLKSRAFSASSFDESTPQRLSMVSSGFCARYVLFECMSSTHRNDYRSLVEPISGRESDVKLDSSLPNKANLQMNGFANSFASMNLEPVDTSQYRSPHNLLQQQARFARQPPAYKYGMYTTLESTDRITSNGMQPEPTETYSQRSASGYRSGSYGQSLIVSPIANDYRNGNRTPVYTTSINAAYRFRVSKKLQCAVESYFHGNNGIFRSYSARS